MTIKKIAAMLALVCCTSITAWAQEITSNTTFYREFKPGIIHLNGGKTLRQNKLNVFLKNGALLYKQGNKTMEANMDNVLSVDFDDRSFVKIECMLAYVVDTVGANKLYCVTLLDIEAYKALIRNNSNITNLSIGDQLSYSTIDLDPQEDQHIPVVKQFYYLYEGHLMRVHERDLKRVVPKDKRRMYSTIISMKGFSWVEEHSLMELLRAIS